MKAYRKYPTRVQRPISYGFTALRFHDDQPMLFQPAIGCGNLVVNWAGATNPTYGTSLTRVAEFATFTALY